MAKTGFPFYRAETDRFQDIKIKRLKKRFHCTGYAVYQYILNEIYRVEGCYLDFGEDEAFECADYWGIDETEVHIITTFCCETGLFDAAMYDAFGVLTSRSIQSRYVDMCKLSKRKVIIPEQYILLLPEEMGGQQQSPAQSSEQQAQSSEQQAQSSGQQGQLSTVAEQNTQTSQETNRRNAPSQTEPPTFEKQAPSAPMSETSENSGKIPKTSGKNVDFPEKQAKTPEKINREEYSREEREKNIPPTCPPEGKEEEVLAFVRNQMQQLQVREQAGAGQKTTNPGEGGGDASNRNTSGLLYQLEQYNLTPGETEEVLRLSNYGELGGEVWKIIAHIRNNAKAIRTPRYFLLSRLRGSCSS